MIEVVVNSIVVVVDNDIDLIFNRLIFVFYYLNKGNILKINIQIKIYFIGFKFLIKYSVKIFSYMSLLIISLVFTISIILYLGIVIVKL